jgi:murein DD-endopeptidase MepM/ murein hydrolase activator NlpD
MNLVKRVMLIAMVAALIIAMNLSIQSIESVFADTTDTNSTTTEASAEGTTTTEAAAPAATGTDTEAAADTTAAAPATETTEEKESITYIKSTDRTSKSVKLEWSDVSTADDYSAVVMNKSGKVIKTKTVSDNEVRVSGLKASTKYKFKVIAKDDEEEIDTSSTVTVKTKARFVRPVKGYVLSGYGYRTGFGSSYHKGVDLNAATGTRVKAAAGGTVILAQLYFGYGKCIKVRHADGYVTLYAHLSRINVRTGQHVSQGQVIARSGRTGSASCSHLHFEITRYGSHMNPMRFI